MKRIGLTLAFPTLLFTSTSAQDMKPTYGAFLSAQLTTAKYKVSDIKQPTGFVFGYAAGVTMKVPFENNLYFSPAVYYSKKGYEVDLNNPSYPPSVKAINNKTSIHTIELSPMLHYDFSQKPAHFFVRLGPSVDFAFAGTEEFDTNEGKHIKRSMTFSFADYGRYTTQAIIHFGYEAENGLHVFAYYSEGLGSLNNADYGPRIKHRITGLTCGWYFHHNPNKIDTRVRE